ncbi:MAG: IS1 family transposase [Euryarchaeota archaeon]|nr:IS1 family transposase [Euryarchaeota archaeon]
MLCVPLRPLRLFFLPENTGSQSGDRSTYLSSYKKCLIMSDDHYVLYKVAVQLRKDLASHRKTNINKVYLTTRFGISRLVRKSLCFSKCKEMLDCQIDMYQCYNNLIRVNSTLTIESKKGEANMKRTSCMAEGITDHIWMW